MIRNDHNQDKHRPGSSQHPRSHAGWSVDLDGDTIVNVEPHVGFLHRGVEKLAETQDVHADTSVHGEARLRRSDVVRRSVRRDGRGGDGNTGQARGRSTSGRYCWSCRGWRATFFWLGALCNDMGQMFTVFMWAFKDRDMVLDLLRGGGRREDVLCQHEARRAERRPAHRTSTEHTIKTMKYLEKRIPRVREIPREEPGVHAEDEGRGRAHQGEGRATRRHRSGAQGIGRELRREEEQSVLHLSKLHFTPKICQGGDNFARYKVRILEMQESVRLVKAALKAHAGRGCEGMPVKLRSPNPSNRVSVVSREMPRGECMMYMVADPQKPYRLSIRSPNFINLAAVNHLQRARGSRTSFNSRDS